jgi:hypothetical protein
MGLEAGPADPDHWVRVFSGLLDDPETGFSEQSARIYDVLTGAGIDARQQPYVLPDHNWSLLGGPSATRRIEVAVLVRRRDESRAERALVAQQLDAHGDR